MNCSNFLFNRSVRSLSGVAMGDNSGYGEWQFCVQAEVSPGETLAVVGDCAELGQWRLHKAFDLQCGNEGSEISSRLRSEPLKCDLWKSLIAEIFGVGAFACQEEKLSLTDTWFAFWCPRMVSSWWKWSESSSAGKRILSPEELLSKVIFPYVTLFAYLTWDFAIDLERAHCRDEPEEFGLVSGLQQVERGWLTSETVVQLKIFGEEPIKMWKRRLLNKQVIYRFKAFYAYHIYRTEYFFSKFSFVFLICRSWWKLLQLS